MKKKTTKVILLAMLISFGLNTIAQVAINTDGSAADPSAMLDVKSTTKGFLAPRVTSTADVTSPATGLLVYQTGETSGYYYYNGTAWITAGQSPGTAAGQMLYWNGTAWGIVSATANEGAALQMIGGVPTWTGGTPTVSVPGAPTIGTATAGDTEASVAFTQPASNGGSTITSYTATSSPGSITGTLTQAGSGTITVTGLTNGTAYTFTVTATNAIGTGPASAASNSVTPTATVIIDVLNPTTGETWMDRNLGATQVATSSTDAASYGDLYQWGRLTDGHQIRTSATTTTSSSTDVPGHGNFIIEVTDWRSPQNNNLWQGVSGTNNPCPTGYRIPTETELNAERESWGSNDAAGAFASPLKLPMAGYRNNSDGSLIYVGINGYYWSSTVDGTNSYYLNFHGGWAYMVSDMRAYGFSVRCIKE